MTNMPPEYAKAQEEFVKFQMPDGTVKQIRRKYVHPFWCEMMAHEMPEPGEPLEPLSPGALILRDAVATTENAPYLTHMRAMLVRKGTPKETFESLHNQLHDIPAPERGE